MRQNVKATSAPDTLTYEGTPAKRLSDEQALRRAIASCLLWEDQFYENGESIADRIKTLTLSVQPKFAADLAREARTRFKLRHAPLWIARHLASGTLAQKAEVTPLLADIIQRPDELTEFLALYWKDGKTPIAASVKRGLALAFQKFNAYSLAKYDRDDKIKLRDVLFLVHAKPKDEVQGAVFKQLVDRTLPIPNTWENRLSAGENKLEVWTSLLMSNELGALALLRNLRNMISVGIRNALIVEALDKCNVERILPFRFIAAARYAPHLEPAIERAMFRCIDGMPKLKGRTALIVDTSPSMWMAKVSAKSDMDRFDAAAALAILAREICEDSRVYAFNHAAYDVPARRGFALRDALAQTKGDASMGGLAVEKANADGYDRIIVLTDGEWHYPMRGNIIGTSHYSSGPAKAVSPAPLVKDAYLINVSSYRNAVGSGKWNMIDGWSEAILDYIQVVEPLA